MSQSDIDPSTRLDHAPPPPPAVLGYATKRSRVSRPRIGAWPGVVAIVSFILGIWTGSLPTIFFIALDEGRYFPDVDLPNVNAGNVIQSFYGVVCLCVVFASFKTRRRGHALPAAIVGFAGGLIYVILPELAMLSRIGVPGLFLAPFFFLVPLVTGLAIVCGSGALTPFYDA